MLRYFLGLGGMLSINLILQQNCQRSPDRSFSLRDTYCSNTLLYRSCPEMIKRKTILVLRRWYFPPQQKINQYVLNSRVVPKVCIV